MKVLCKIQGQGVSACKGYGDLNSSEAELFILSVILEIRTFFLCTVIDRLKLRLMYLYLQY